MNVEDFVDRIAGLSFPNVFNPYSDRCEIHDKRDAPAIRRHNLALAITGAIESNVEYLWVARDLGYRGGRRTGLALTDDVHVSAFGSMLGVPVQRATTGEAVAERTAATVWKIIREFNKPFFTWNVFPFHPFENGDQFTNRQHTRRERMACQSLLENLIQILQPKQIIAIGNSAAEGLLELGVKAEKVRHPSYGGTADFVSGLSSIYHLQPLNKTQSEFSFHI